MLNLEFQLKINVLEAQYAHEHNWCQDNSFSTIIKLFLNEQHYQHVNCHHGIARLAT